MCLRFRCIEWHSNQCRQSNLGYGNGDENGYGSNWDHVSYRNYQSLSSLYSWEYDRQSSRCQGLRTVLFVGVFTCFGMAFLLGMQQILTGHQDAVGICIYVVSGMDCGPGKLQRFSDSADTLFSAFSGRCIQCFQPDRHQADLF